MRLPPLFFFFLALDLGGRSPKFRTRGCNTSESKRGKGAYRRSLNGALKNEGTGISSRGAASAVRVPERL